MDVIIQVPNIGFEEAEIIEILVNVGDIIESDQGIVTVEGQKASIEIPTTISGVVKKIFVAVGDIVIPGTEVVMITSNQKKENNNSLLKSSSLNNDDNTYHITNKFKTSIKQTNIPHLSYKTLLHASPAVRRLSRENNINLDDVKPSGPKGRILKQDVELFLKNKEVLHDNVNIKQYHQDDNDALLMKKTNINSDQFGVIESLKLSSIQKKVSINLSKSWKTIPHVTHFDEIDVTQLEKFRKKLNMNIDDNVKKITLLPFIIKSLIQSLQLFSKFNSSFDEKNNLIIFKKYINIGIAVDIEDGLTVPVLKNSEQYSIQQIAKNIDNLVENARNHTLNVSDLKGSSFTVSNLGKIGGTGFTPIINYPEVAILGLSQMCIKPIWNNDKFIPRSVIPISLTYDHRIINGLESAKFIDFLKKNISSMNFLLS
ncbi:2-oxo acid dehydrogenase subunit E2 [Buchnera aphidicola]|nr:2-oxo acid dehydrogenase subunit E2 [Buchnera aphidicola]